MLPVVLLCGLLSIYMDNFRITMGTGSGKVSWRSIEKFNQERNTRQRDVSKSLNATGEWKMDVWFKLSKFVGRLYLGYGVSVSQPKDEMTQF